MNAFPFPIASWIWQGEPKEDSYLEFKGRFSCQDGQIELCLASEADFALYIDKTLVDAAELRHSKGIVGVRRTFFPMKEGRHDYVFLLHHIGSKGFSTYEPSRPSLCFCFLQKEKVLSYSGPSTLSRISPFYLSGKKRKISPQLGYAYECDFQGGGNDFDWAKSQAVEAPSPLVEEALSHLNSSSLVRGDAVIQEVSRLRLRFLKETVGWLSFAIEAQEPCDLEIVYSEHLKDGEIPYAVGERDFRLLFHLKQGENRFTGPFLRLACRYLEARSSKPIKFNEFGVVPVSYPFKEKGWRMDDPKEEKIFKMARYTLECCFHEHFEDCPWREQSLYALDGMLQARSGYVCFDNSETVASSIRLFLESQREDGLLPITAPSDNGLLIPSFSLHFVRLVKEYGEQTHDLALLQEAYPSLKRLLEAFLSREKDGLIQNFSRNGDWNFYAWEEGLDGQTQEKTDLILNCLLLLALNDFHSLSESLGMAYPYGMGEKRIRLATKQAFYVPKTRLCSFSESKESYSQLGISLSILSGVADSKEFPDLADRLIHDSSLTHASLSSKSFLYDALLKASPSYQTWILKDIGSTWGKMAEEGSSTCYETELGWKDFDEAGSLCHGWSSIAPYYYEKFGLLNKK